MNGSRAAFNVKLIGLRSLRALFGYLLLFSSAQFRAQLVSDVARDFYERKAADVILLQEKVRNQQQFVLVQACFVLIGRCARLEFEAHISNAGQCQRFQQSFCGIDIIAWSCRSDESHGAADDRAGADWHPPIGQLPAFSERSK